MSVIRTLLPDLHHREEGRIEVCHHIVTDVDIVLEFREHEVGKVFQLFALPQKFA